MTHRADRARSLLRIAAGFLYDVRRYARFARRGAPETPAQRSFAITKVYHSLEKSLAFRDRRESSGWRDAARLISLFSASGHPARPETEQERVALKVLQDYAAVAPKDHPDYPALENFLGHYAAADFAPAGGAVESSAGALEQGTLPDSERFFRTRHSVRDFAPRPVAPELIGRAVALAATSPSVCNRQSWHVYRLTGRAAIDRALSFQNGNRGFGHEVPCLLIVAVDLQAFEDGYERYQPWIDGGIFAMSLVLGLHALGVSSCFLNWSKGPRGDMALRQAFPIAPEHSLVTMIAVGYPKDRLKLCASVRRPADELLTDLT